MSKRKSKSYTPTRGALKGRRFTSKQAYRNALAKSQGFVNATAKRVQTGVAKGRSVQASRGHAKGDKGKVATRTRGSRYAPKASKIRSIFTEHTSSGAETAGSTEYYVFPYQRDAREETAAIKRVLKYAEQAYRSGGEGIFPLYYRFVYVDERYKNAFDEDEEGMGVDALASTGYYRYGWSRSKRADRERAFESDYFEIKGKSVDGIHFILFGYAKA